MKFFDGFLTNFRFYFLSIAGKEKIKLGII